MLFAICFNLDLSKILSSGNRLTAVDGRHEMIIPLSNYYKLPYACDLHLEWLPVTI